ncbi:2,4-dienoyl-CoA reductase, putative [Bodo saltans]|uniref:2,4-dienoyl-CoA reductase, putative n=1 Tax=Bodo saltans TaxID=75058 RepID=A0A0S4JCH5_BODSA|nr:2,4-dienoyl-CoA reductase, putative [Bodo saltans]|eukprot:CUG87865.1 2,4-dienoyl-CoA reductase, putative [Bodo saltans]
MFTPIRVGKFLIPNRFMMSPLYLNIESDVKRDSPAFFESMSQFYGERAANSASLVVVGGVAPSNMGRWNSKALSLTSSRNDGLRLVSSAIRKQEGVSLLQAFHGGRSSFKRFRLAASSETTKVHPFREFPPVKIPSMFMDTIVGEYERFAMLAEDLGFDGIELSFSDGGLIHNFLSSATNTRDDQFGGCLENRMELALRVLANVRNSLKKPNDFLISVRLCMHDLKSNGNSMSDNCTIAEYLCGSGAVDLLTSSVGMHDSPVQTLSSTVPQGTFAKCTQKVRNHLRAKGITTPVAASHRIHSSAVAKKLLDEDFCDMIGIGRPLLADSQFIRKIELGVDGDIIPCIGCNHCVNKLYKLERVACAVNPLSGFTEDKWRNAPPAKYQKNVAVVGGGAAGIVCALTLAQRGHNVVLYERSNEIGGQMNLAKVVPGKGDYFALLKYWTYKLRDSTVKVRLNTEFSEREVTSGHQAINAVVLCCGSIMRPIKSNYIPGASECNIIVPFWKILDGSVVAGRRVVILGNGAIAFDVASYLLHDQRVSRSDQAYCVEWGVNLEAGTLDCHAQTDATKNNRDVIILNKTEKDADLSKGKGWSQKLWLKNHRATVLQSAMVEKIHPDGVTVSIILPDNRIFFIPADTIVWANGMLPNISTGTWIYEWVKDGAESRGQITHDFGIYAAGTCRDAYSGDGHGEQDLLQVVHEAFEIGCKI